TASFFQPAWVSTNTLPGRLMQISVMSSLRRKPCNESSSSDSEVADSEATFARRATAVCSMLCIAGLEFIDPTEIDIPRRQYLNPIAVVLDHRGRDVERPFQHL